MVIRQVWLHQKVVFLPHRARPHVASSEPASSSLALLHSFAAFAKTTSLCQEKFIVFVSLIMDRYKGFTPAPDESVDAVPAHFDTESSIARDIERFSSENSVGYIFHGQIRNVAKRRIWGLLWTVFLVFLILAILRIWEHEGYIPTSQKTLFNFLSTVFSILLGPNFSVYLPLAVTLSDNTDERATL